MQTTSMNTISALNSLLRGELAATETYQQALAKVDDQPGTQDLRKIHAEHREAAFLARQLTEIACNMPLEIGHAELTRRAPDVAALTAFFDHHNFGPMLRKQAERLALLPLHAAAAA